MTDAEKLERLAKLVAEEIATKPLGLWYLSYADDDGFRGAIYVEAHGPTNAALKARNLKLSPGGQVAMFPVPADKVPPYTFWNRLLTKEEVQAANPDDECKTIGEFEAERDGG